MPSIAATPRTPHQHRRSPRLRLRLRSLQHCFLPTQQQPPSVTLSSLPLLLPLRQAHLPEPLPSATQHPETATRSTSRLVPSAMEWLLQRSICPSAWTPSSALTTPTAVLVVLPRPR